MIEFIADGEDYIADSDCNAAYSDFKKTFIDFMRTHDKVAVMVQHWGQQQRYPHVHILYQRTPRKHNEFQKWLCNE